MATGELKLDQVSHFVLDEADRMLDLGFIRDIRRIVAALPTARQSALFSATMPAEVGKLAETLLRDPVRVDVARTAPVDAANRAARAFRRSCRQAGAAGSVADRSGIVATSSFSPARSGLPTGSPNRSMPAAFGSSALHGNKSQPARQQALEQFRSGRARVLVATDIAARGIDVTGISHVINFDLPAQAGGLRAPHRPDCARRRQRCGDLVLRRHGAWHTARNRADHRHRDPCCGTGVSRRSADARTATCCSKPATPPPPTHARPS